MRILQLIFSLTSGGAEKFTVDLSNELSKSHEVYLCVILSEENENNSFFKSQIGNKVNYINLSCSKGINLKTFITIFKLVIKIKPDVVHSHLNTILYLYLPALIFKNKIKFIHTLHNIASKTIGFRWQKNANRIFYKLHFIDAVAISEQNENSFKEYYRHNNITLIRNGVSNPVKSDEFKSVKDELLKLKIKPSDKIFIHIASFSQAKNHNLLIDVFNRLIEENTGLILLIIGGNFNTEEANILKAKSNSGIYFLGTRSNISDYLLNSDVFVLSSLWEGLPISLLEALSCGVIPVCTPAGGIPNVIKDESIGYVSDDFTEEGLYGAVVKCLNKIETFDRINLKKYYNLNFSMVKCAKEYEGIYFKKDK